MKFFFFSIFLLSFHSITSFYTCINSPSSSTDNRNSETSETVCCNYLYAKEISNTLLCFDEGITDCPDEYPKTYNGYCLHSCEEFYLYEDDNNECVDNCPRFVLNNKCVDSCEDSEIKIIYNKQCLVSCPPNTEEITDLSGFKTCKCLKKWHRINGQVICDDVDNCIENSPYEYSIDGSSECVQQCDNTEIEFRGTCYKECPGKFVNISNHCDCPITNYYYYEDNLKYCISDDENNEEYQFIVSGTKEKVKNCGEGSTDATSYKFRYYLECLQTCPEGSTVSNFVCSCPNFYYEDKNNNKICIDSCPSSDPYLPYLVFFQTSNEPKACTDKCKSDFYFFNKNCYEKCPDDTYEATDSNGVKICRCIKNWYFDSEGKIICENTHEQCDNPNNKLIVKTNECVSECKIPDTIEFNNKCYRQCPENSNYLDSENTCECMYKWYKDGNDIICLGQNEDYSIYNKLIIATNEIVSDCSGQAIYNIEFNNTCISQIQCDENPMLSSLDIDNNGTPEKLCVCDNYYIEDENKNIICLNNNECPENYKFQIENKKTGKNYCVKRCPNEYKEFNHQCLDDCPLGTFEVINSNNLLTCQCINQWFFNNHNLMECNDIKSCQNVIGKNKYILELNQCVNECEADQVEFNNICYRECPLNSYEIEIDGKKTCKCLYNWFNSNDEIVCLGEGELNSNYPLLIEDTKELVQKCSDSNQYIFQFNKNCYIGCPENSFSKIDENGEKICVCQYLYAIDLKNNKICYDENVESCGFDEALDYPFTIQLDDLSKYCMKFCPLEFEYLFNKFCYKICPSYLKTDSEKKICECINFFYFEVSRGENICKDTRKECNNDGYIYLDISNNECLKKCRNNKVIFDNFCVNECPDNAFFNHKNDIICHCIDKYEMEINGKKCLKMEDNYEKNKNILKLIDDNLMNIYNKNKIVEINNLQIEITDIDKQKSLQDNENKNLTLIDFSECEKNLRTEYQIPNDEPLLLVKIDINPISQSTITNAVEYLIYRKDGTLLNLSPCENLDLKIVYPITNSTLANLEVARQLIEKNIDIYDQNSIFYFDFCSHYSINGTDIPLKQRREKIFVNINFCENNCILEKIDIYNENVICNCKVKLNAEIDNEKTYFGKPENNFVQTVDNIINIKIVKCYKLFSELLTNISNNMGLWIGVILIFANLILVYLYIRIELIILKSKLFKVYAGNPPILGKCCNRETVSSDREILKIYSSKGETFNFEDKKQSNYKFNKNNKNKNDNNKYKIKNINNFLKNKKKSKFNEKNNNYSISLKNNSKNTILNNSNVENQETNNESIFQLDKYSGVTFEKAKLKRKKFFLISWFSIFISKVDIITILFFREKFELITILLSLFFLDLLLDFTVNALMYTDNVASDTYDNGGGIDMSVSIGLSLLSNLICYVIMNLISKLVEFASKLTLLDNEVKDEEKYNRYALKILHIIKIRIIIYFIIQFIIMFGCVYYLYIFCCIYKSNQSNLIQNYFMGVLENIIIPMILSSIICVLRYFAFKFNSKQLYYSANFIDSF